MNSTRHRKMDSTAIWHPYTRLSSLVRPLPVIARGRGPYLYDAEGRRHLDAISSWWAANLGHGNKRIIRAIVRQTRVLQHSILGGMSHPPAVELASRIVRLFPDPDRRVMFASDGASAVEAALKIAVQYWHNRGHPERNELASLRNAYHGDTLGAVSVGYLPGFHAPFKRLLFPVRRADSPCCAACKWGLRPGTCGEKCFDSMRRVFEKHGSRLAAVIIEPLCQCAAGMRIYPAGYLRKLAALCRKRGSLLIADEIAVGMGRTGRMFAFEHAGIDPDIVCLGKGLSGGYLPLSATVVKNSVFRTFADKPSDRTFYHGHTFAGNPIACAAALETLAIYREDKVVQRARRLGAILADEMRTLEGIPGVSGVRSLGMIAAFETPDAARVRDMLLEHDRILVRPLGNTLYLMLPLISSERLVRSTVRSLRATLLQAAG